jgi:hypothetical protein
MRPEEEFAAELAESYVRKGWEVERPEEASSFLRFQSDLLLRRELRPKVGDGMKG